jgi:hypothetical protein
MSTKTASLKLVTSAEQAAELSSLAEVYAKACDMVAAFAREHRCWNRVALHHLAYYPVREAIPTLGSQMACQAVHRAADAYKTLKANGEIRKGVPVPSVTFRPTSVNYDKRTYSIHGETLSLFTQAGRARIPFVCGEHQRGLMSAGVPKEARLVARNGVWYFNLVLDVPDAPPAQGSGVIGVDVPSCNLHRPRPHKPDVQRLRGHLKAGEASVLLRVRNTAARGRERVQEHCRGRHAYRLGEGCP